MSKDIRIVLTNRDAKFNYEIIDTITAGIMLQGSEMKPLVNSLASINEAFVYIDIDTCSVWIRNMYIKNINSNHYSHGEHRERKLLLTKQQIKKWYKMLKNNSITIIPIRCFFDENNLVKIDISLAKGKKLWNKKESIKENDIKRENERALV